MVFDILRPAYLDAVYEVECECFSKPWSRAQFAGELDNPLAHYWIALDGRVVAGYGGLWQVCGDGQITNIAVRPAYRRQGLGRAIVEAMSSYGIQAGLFQLTLEVREGNLAALQLYRACGFAQVGKRPQYYDGEAAILMTKPLGGDAVGIGIGD